ncbi:organic cation transporter protein isoform X2 [Octopus sinensis]|uniref:Organic cation transporter protein isoform X1 n=3 Tax=Octopus sinensis TaxID=2607531 RepID=A0A7E6FA52_9MOLL|nr:organic cation transporter protein isoform X1 [Octopus sinensis]XP_036364176.1 organic cation transporter protein isoform X2 [Octopus sinensis]
MAEEEENQLKLENQMATRKLYFECIFLLCASLAVKHCKQASKLATLSDNDITKLIEQCGTFGPYQRWLYTYIIIVGTLTIMPAMNLAFISANVPFLCYPPNFNASLIPANLTENEYLQMLQPDGDSQCSVYNNSFTGTYYTTPSSNSSKLQCSYGRKFLTEDFSTIVSEFDLVCERKWLRSTLQSVYFAGSLLGAIIFGVLSDRFGRIRVFLLANTCIVICGTGKIFIPSLIILMMLHCIQASGYTGNTIALYSLTLEFTSSKLRTRISFGYMCLYPVAAIFVTVLVYCIPDWHFLELTVCLLPAISFFIWIFLPESPRWLIGRKRFTEAKALFQKIMKKNKKQCQDLLKGFPNNEEELSLKNSFHENIPEKKVLSQKNYTFIDLFRTPRLAITTVNVCFSWLVASMLYYGVTLHSVDMAGNRYVNFLLLAFVEFPSHLTSFCLFKRFDHRRPICFFLMFSGLNCIVSNFVTKGSFWFPLILVVLGKFGIASAYGSIYLLSAELFPTVVRANGLGLASFFARIGSISGPFILQLSSYVKWLPLSIFGLLAVIAGLLLLLLPETKNRDLPQTFEDLDNWKS